VSRSARAASAPATAGTGELPRTLGLFDATMINVGTIVASGIFLVPTDVARRLDSAPLNLAVWVVATVVSLLGALTIAELGAALPRAGGLFVYLREAYGPIWGFFYGWALFIVIQTGSIAAVAVAFATYLSHFVPLGTLGVKAVAVLSIAVLTGINVLGVREGAWTQNVVTVAKILVIGGLLAIAFSAPTGSWSNLAEPGSAAASWPLWLAFGTALLGPLWAFDGWIHTSYVGGEIRNPGRNLPWSTIASVVIVGAVYLALNAAYLYVLRVDGIARSELVAADTAAAVLGAAGAGFAAALVMLTTLGSTNGMILAGPRVYYAMARDGLFFPAVARVHSRFRTPAVSLLVQATWSALLVFTGTYEQLFTYVVFASWVFYGMGAAAVFVLRRRRDLVRPYEVWGYPWVPALFVAFTGALLANTLLTRPRDSLVGLGLMLAGVPFYLFWRRRAPARPA
jgi:APA family basic amino acid/polyamine antiporter